MSRHYTIGQLARGVGVPTSTVRYYERVGLLHPTGRSGGNYRLYREEALQRLWFIRAAQAMVLIKNRNTIDDVITTLPMFPTLAEALKLAALSFTRDLAKLSCCI